MLFSQKTSIYFFVELSLREISYAMYMYVHVLDHALICLNLIGVRMSNAILRNHHRHYFAIESPVQVFRQAMCPFNVKS